MTRPDRAALIAGLRAWTRDHDPHVRAAVELLIEHDVWLRRADFTRARIVCSGREAYVNWVAARAFADAGTVASTSETAILDLASRRAGREPLPADGHGRRQRPVDHHRSGPRDRSDPLTGRAGQPGTVYLLNFDQPV